MSVEISWSAKAYRRFRKHESMQRKTLSKPRTTSRSSHLQKQSVVKSAAKHPLMALHQSIGNQAVQRLIRSPYIQAKLNVSTPGDQFEQEADRVADTVMRMPDAQVNPGATVSNQTQISRLQRQCTECEEKVQRQELEEEEEPVQMKLDGQRPIIQRLRAESSDKVLRRPAAAEEENEEEEEMVQGKAAEGGGNQVSQGVQSQIEGFRGGGQPLPESSRAYFEPRFGHDFGGVRIHAGAQAAESAGSINAQAFTVGRNVAFAAGQYSPETGAGKRLLAHELTHVIQQNGGTPGWLGGARQGLTIQRQTGTNYGLAGAGSQNKYVAEAVRLWTTNKTMKVQDFVDALMKAIQTDLLSQGVPELKWQMSPGSGLSGSFDSEKWIVNIDPGAFSSRQTITEVKDLNLDEVREVVGTLYHESRHTDQDVMIIRVLLDQKKAVKDIVQETKIPDRIVNAVKATKFKTPPDTAQVAHATRMFAVMYGQHKELLSLLMNNTQLVAGVQALVSAIDADDLKDAAPHVEKLAEWKKNVLEPKVKNLQAGKKGGPQEAQLTQDLGALNQVTAQLLAVFATAVKMKNPTEARLQDLRHRTDEWQKKLVAAYKNLEGEKDAFAIEESVKKAFEKGAKAKPTPAPTKAPAPTKK